MLFLLLPRVQLFHLASTLVRPINCFCLLYPSLLESIKLDTFQHFHGELVEKHQVVKHHHQLLVQPLGRNADLQWHVMNMPCPTDHWTLQWKGLDPYDAGVFLGPQDDASDFRGFRIQVFRLLHTSISHRIHVWYIYLTFTTKNQPFM